MGNCIACESQTQWGGEDWSSLVTPPAAAKGTKQKGSSYDMGSTSARRKTVNRRKVHPIMPVSEQQPNSTQVKVKISKKQLQQLAEEIKRQRVSAKQILEQLEKVGAQCETYSTRSSWKPRLQSISEVN